ncbi:uncharacterized protein N0V89_010092 [Didymosphaeria variabile]|uniref:Uncharacterized protein n=1 Tax=Didymosphaeria variabile TaxID=1932322 RepID=A0A9W8XGE2_9PLEO|nr:uncharacterized protein N0V89_010092 [Didymosphaeria variabile]KAJ4348714.1 hypothetical protein N0V89_010092 [Didymosphaeria variabile]
MEGSRQPRKRPQSEVKQFSHARPTHGQRRTRSTRTTAGINPANQHTREDTPAIPNAFAEFKFFDDEEPGPGEVPLPIDNRLSLGLSGPGSAAVSELSPERHLNHLTNPGTYVLSDSAVPDTPPRLSFPQYIDEDRLRLGELTHPSGSPVLRREVIVNVERPDLNAFDQKLDHDPGETAEHSVETQKVAGLRSIAESPTQEDELPVLRGSALAALNTPTVSVAKHVARADQGDSENQEPKVVNVSKNSNEPELRQRKYSVDQNPQHTQPVYNGAQKFLIRRKSLPIAAEFAPETPTTTLEATRELLKDLVDQESGTRSIESVVDPSQDIRGTAKETLTTSQARPATPGPAVRPASPPLHRNAADNRNPLEKQDRETWTLYNLSCWTDKAFLKTLLKGPTVEFRVEAHSDPFLTNVSQEMLKHFCGEQHLARLIRDYSLQPDLRTEDGGEKNILIFPERSVDATAILRIVRYMRRCCMRTTTITKPHFQLHAPPSLEANIETIRACNIFGLYADARRLQYFLTDKKIPGGKLTMEDVETIWEGYGGGLRDSVYTDALLTHLVYNVLGSDSVDREDFMVLLDQEEFAGLRELVGTELGIKKRAAEDREMFQMRLQLEREERVNQALGKGKRLTKMEKIRASRGPMVQGRLLRVLSYDALLEPDLTAETRYKARPGLKRRSLSTSDLTDKSNEAKEPERLDSAGRLFQNALKEIKESGAGIGRAETILKEPSDAEERITLSAIRTPGRPAGPTPSGRKHRSGRPEQWRGQHSEDTRPEVPPKDPQPGVVGIGGVRQEKTTLLRNAAAHPNTQPQDAPRTRLYARSISSGGLLGNGGKTQPGSSVVTSQRAPMLRSRTDPYWATLGNQSRPAKKKTPSKLKQVWDEMRNFF